MAKSLDSLIRHLVDQIALCGEHGASPLDFITHVKSYYDPRIEDNQAQGRDPAVFHPRVDSKVDRPLLEQVWKWLIRDPEIKLGSHTGQKQLTLSEVEARNAAVEQSNQPISVSREIEPPRAVTPLHTSDLPTVAQDGDNTQYQHMSGAASSEIKDTTVLQETIPSPGIRLYASKNRMWHALAGHGPDSSKIKSLDFVCLSIIAAHGPQGILQHDLVRISGQDKRSLPARTDRLRNDGYIEKKRVSVVLYGPERLLHTSKCTLKRFVNNPSNQKQQTDDSGSAPVRKAKRMNRKRPIDRDSQAPESSPSAATLGTVPKNTALPESRPIPLWTADRSISNQIFELVDRAGIKGMSMTEIRDCLMGYHIRKPLEEYVSRLVQSWQLSQPLHIRHLSIVRDTLLKGKTQIYMYYTYKSFKKLVEGGTVFWEGVTTIPIEVARGKNVAASLDAKPDVDEYGFPRLEKSQFQGPHNDATLKECVAALKIDPLHISIHDPILKSQADGGCEVRYRSHQQRSVNIGNSSSRKKAASMPFQAASGEARVADLEEPLSCALTSKPHNTEPIAVPKPPEVLAKGQTDEYQISRRRHFRKPDSKPWGRPRKYPKTGVPSNFDTLKPDEIEALFRSQEMFEKYEIVKIEKEIVRRIEDGGDAEIVANEVLTEWDDSRKQERELPLPTTSRAQVLHKFAGVPIPVADSDETRSKVRVLEDNQYRPSMAAHNSFVPTSQMQTLPETKNKGLDTWLPIFPTPTHKRVSDPEPKIYLPSVAAHSWPYICQTSSAIGISAADALQKGIKRKQGRSTKSKQLPAHQEYLAPIAAHSDSHLPPASIAIARAGRKRKRNNNVLLENKKEHITPLQYKYLPSIAAHSGSFLPLNALHAAKTEQKRKRTADILTRRHDHHATSFTSSTATSEPFIAPVRERSVGESSTQLDRSNEGIYPGWERFMWKYYQQQLEQITRSNAGGLFFGTTNPRRKRPCEPRGFRPTHFKLAVFKSTRLSHLDWFVRKPSAPEPISRSNSRDGTPKSQITEPAPVPVDESTSEAQPDPLGSIFLPPRDSSSLAPKPTSTYISPYADIPRTERKPTTSPQPTGGEAPNDPFPAGPDSRQQVPNTEILELIDKSSTPVKTAAVAPVPHEVCKDSSIEHQTPARTPEKQPDTDESSEQHPDAPILIHSPAMQSKVAMKQTVQQSRPSTSNGSKPSDKQSITKLNRRGGSTAILRKNIIMEIVEKCAGVFPSHKEMSSPFATEWKRRGQEGTPESKTISNAVDALIRERKLRQITFTSQTTQGITVTKSMLILPAIDTDDPRVKETQTNMVAYHPRHFIPAALLPPQECHSTETCDDKINNEEHENEMTEGTVQDSSALKAPESHRIDIAKKIIDGKDRAAMARLKALKEQDQDGLGQTDGDEPPAHYSFQRATNDVAHAARGPGKEILPKDTPKRPGGHRARKRVERLASIKKPVPSQIPLMPAMPINPVNVPVSLTWLPSNYAFSDFNFEGDRPTVLARDDLQNGTREVYKLLDSNDEAEQRIRKLATNAARIERKQALANSTRSSLFHTGLNPEQLDSPYAPTGPASNSPQALTPGQPFQYTQSPAGVANINMTVRRGDDLGLENIASEKRRQLPLTSNHRRRNSLSTTVSPVPESSLSCISGQPVASHTGALGTYSRLLLVSFMDPVHHFHRATGTFSVTFFGLQPPRKIFRHRRTALDSSSANLEIKQPYGPLSLQKVRKSNKTLFDEEVDALLRKELEETESNHVVLVGWPFVNHMFSHAHQKPAVVEANMEAAEHVTIRLKDGRLIFRPFSRKNESRPKYGNSTLSTGSGGIDHTVAQSRTPLKRRRLTSVLELGTQDKPSKDVDLDHESRPAKLRRIRGPRQAKSLGENGEERLVTAVMVVRALTGGLDKRIDWVLVAKVFEPTYTQMFVHSRWNFTLQKYKLVLPKMEADFQNIFASAYEEGTVPAIDYDNLQEYNWKWLVEWTMANVDTPTHSLPELPLERSEFDGLYTVAETSDNEINEFYEIDGTSALPKRIKVVHRDPYVLPLIRERRNAQPAEGARDLSTVKSWIRANIITPESTYNPSAARAKLSIFPERMVEDALKQLLLDRVFTQENKGRLVPGRNYDVSDFFITRLKKNLQSAQFHRAAKFKQQLDHDFEEKGFAKYSYAAEDGDMIVIINLLAHRRIMLVPIDVPMNKWGHTDGGYETRQMDKKRLDFSLELRPSSNYIYGNPLGPLPTPPSHHLLDPMAKIPLWYDINDSLVPVMWEMALAATVAVLAMRPGIGASELEKVMRPAMEVWELQEILEWLVTAKAAKRVDQGFNVEDEWWWLVLGTGKNNAGYSHKDVGDREERGEAKGKGEEQERTREDALDVITMDLD